MASLKQAVRLCRMLEEVAPDYGCHIALTGGCLYKTGERKDIDIIVYRIRQVEKIDVEGFLKATQALGLKTISGFGFCIKSEFVGTKIDFLFPEDPGDYPGLKLSKHHPTRG